MDWRGRFLAAAKRRGIRPRTLEAYGKKLDVLSSRGLDLSKCSGKRLVSVMDELSGKKRSYYRDMAIFARSVLKFLGRNDLVKLVEIPKPERRTEKVREKVLDDKDVKTLISKAPRLGDRLLFELFYETGGRVGEILNLRIKDIQFDDKSGIVWLRGKTNPRYRRVYSAVPDLKAYFNNHPMKDNGEAKFFDYTYVGLYSRIKELGKQILGRNIHPHMFRHTRATLDSKYFTDRDMMMLHGWTTPSTVSVYSHLTMKDVDDKDLVLHGKKSKEEVLKPLLEVRKCVKCGSENAPISLFCHKCGQVLGTLGLEATQKEMKKAREETKELATKVLSQHEIMESLKKQISDMNEKILYAGLDQTVTFIEGLYTAEKMIYTPKQFKDKYGFIPIPEFEKLKREFKRCFVQTNLKKPDLDDKTRRLFEEASSFWEGPLDDNEI